MLKPDNNVAANAIRPFVLYRINWLFAGHTNGANASAAILFSNWNCQGQWSGASCLPALIVWTKPFVKNNQNTDNYFINMSIPILLTFQHKNSWQCTLIDDYPYLDLNIRPIRGANSLISSRSNPTNGENAKIPAALPMSSSGRSDSCTKSKNRPATSHWNTSRSRLCDRSGAQTDPGPI